MFESKLTTRSAWGDMTSIYSTSAPGFVPIPCPSHQQYSITNICKSLNCIEPLCPQCISSHVKLHQQTKKPAKIQNILSTRTKCIEQLAIMKYDTQKEIQQSLAGSSGNIEPFIQSHQKKLQVAHKKVIKIVNDIFQQMNRQMQVISNAYAAEKEKRQRQIKMKISPLNDFFNRISQYKQQLQSQDYIPALIQLLNEPPKKPKYEGLGQIQNFGSVEVNQKYLEDIKTDVAKFVKVIVNCKDQSFKNKLQLSKISSIGTNNMKFSRIQRDRSLRQRDNSESRMNETKRSNSKKKIFGCESIVSDIKPAIGSSSKYETNNSLYHGLQQTNNRKSNSSSIVKRIRFNTIPYQIKGIQASSFMNTKASLWYFKERSKYGFRASLQLLEAGFEKIQLKINFLIPENHKTIILPNGSTYIIGGEMTESGGILNKIMLLDENYLYFKEMPPMSQCRKNFAACFSRDFIFVAGGIVSETNKWPSRKVTSQFQRYNVRQNYWQKLSPLPEPAYQFCLCPISSNRILKLGGITSTNQFIYKVDIFQVNQNFWISLQTDNRFVMTSNPGIVQLSNNSLIIFGGSLPKSKQSLSNCYILSQQQNGESLAISQGPELYNEADFESAYTYDNSIIAIQNNETSNRNKLIMGFKYEQWKFISC